MKHIQNEVEWLSEPTVTDDSWRRDGEQLINWLGRSTLPQAQTARQFLKGNLDELPQENRSYFIRGLTSNWEDIFLEFILARMTQLLGGSFKMERKNSEGKCPDFLVKFGEDELIIEVTSPRFDAKGEDERKYDAPLLKFINSNIPRGWSVNVIELPKIGPEDSQKEFKEKFLQVCKELQIQEEFYEINLELRSGYLHLRFFQEELGYEPVISGRLYPFDENPAKRIRQSIQHKRRQVRAESLPVILAVQASGYGVTFDDFDRALFGHSFTSSGGGNNKKIKFNRNGIFLEPGKEEKKPTYAGILAFKRIDLKRRNDPVLYRHPRFNENLPVQLTNFEQREFQLPDKIVVHPPKHHNILAGLDFTPGHL